jgi:hypothetical protein
MGSIHWVAYTLCQLRASLTETELTEIENGEFSLPKTMVRLILALPQNRTPKYELEKRN